MNRRARNRLIGVVVLIAVISGAAYFLIGGSGSKIMGVGAFLDDPVVGERVKVTGIVVDGSWDGKANPMSFEVSDKDDPGKALPVTYGGTVPSGFGKDTKATLTGTLGADGVFTATNMLTQCPSKYQKQAAPLEIEALLANDKLRGTTVKVNGFVKEVTAGGVTLQSAADGGQTLAATIAGELPSGVAAGSRVTLTGQLDPAGVFKSTGIDPLK